MSSSEASSELTVNNFVLRAGPARGSTAGEALAGTPRDGRGRLGFFLGARLGVCGRWRAGPCMCTSCTLTTSIFRYDMIVVGALVPASMILALMLGSLRYLQIWLHIQ